MNRLFIAAGAIFAFVITSPASAVTVFQATLSGIQEVPPNASTATGSATLVLNDAQDALSITIDLVGLDLDGLQTPGDPNDNVTGAHIHRAPSGSNGGVVFGFIGPNNDLDGDLVIDAGLGSIQSVWDGAEGNGTTLAAELGNLFADGLYINIHTPLFPGGEIRGQINLVPIPAAVWLFGSGLLGLLAVARGRRQIP